MKAIRKIDWITLDREIFQQKPQISKSTDVDQPTFEKELDEKFKKIKSSQTLIEIRVQEALLVEGVGEESCPTQPVWQAFLFAGSVVATLTGKHLDAETSAQIVAGNETCMTEGLWFILQEAIEQNGNILDPTFRNLVLSMFKPHTYPADFLDSSFSRNHFVRNFTESDLRLTDTESKSIGNLRAPLYFQHKKVMCMLPDNTADSIRLVAPHMKPILRRVLSYIKRNYVW